MSDSTKPTEVSTARNLEGSHRNNAADGGKHFLSDDSVVKA
jgi:hypothetical protein